MTKTYIAVIGTIDKITTEEVPLREIAIIAKDVYEAHKSALFKCDHQNEETVFKIKESTTNLVLFEHKTGFIK